HAVSLQNIVNFGDLIQKAYSAETTIDFANKERAAVNQQRKDFGKYKQQLKWRVYERQRSLLLLQATRAYEERMSQVEELRRSRGYYGEQRPCLYH
ncbi:hypothetical protein A2U01_0057297, partial [Trifolium medium]|nr:hypothetical protein [Trifolium medium]